MSLLQQVRGEVSAAGETVTLSLGTSVWPMHYETALVLAHWMKKCARTVRPKLALSKPMGAGTLHDAEKGPDFGQPFTPGKLYPVARSLVKLDRVSVGTDIGGTLVAVRLGNDELTIGHMGAEVIAQWLRLRAKDCKRRAGDMNRHWSVIAQQGA